MSKVKLLVIVGVVTSIMPYTGFPLYFKNILITLCGFEILYVAFLLYKEREPRAPERTFENFKEAGEQ